MKRLTTLAIGALLVSGCDGAAIKGGANAEKVTQDAVVRCIQAAEAREGAMGALMAEQQSASYAAEMKAAAETCASSIRQLKSLDPQHPCIPSLRLFEGLSWALARLRTHSQNSTVAARAMADRKTVGHRS